MVEALLEDENQTSVADLAAEAKAAAAQESLMMIDTSKNAGKADGQEASVVQADESYEETQMNMNGFFADNND